MTRPAEFRRSRIGLAALAAAGFLAASLTAGSALAAPTMSNVTGGAPVAQKVLFAKKKHARMSNRKKKKKRTMTPLPIRHERDCH